MFGESIRQARLNRGMSQAQLSSETGIPQTSISDLERDKYIPKADVCLKLAKALDFEISDLFEVDHF